MNETFATSHLEGDEVKATSMQVYASDTKKKGLFGIKLALKKYFLTIAIQ